MDIFAHTLWTSALAREANAIREKGKTSSEIKKRNHVSVGWAAFFGIFPDLFAFTIPFFLRFYLVVVGGNSLGEFFRRPPEDTNHGLGDGFNLAHNLYNYSHSLVIWAVVFIIVWVYFKRPRFELFGWALHILIDIPSHVLAFFPTPFLFPISDYRFPYGVQWSNWYFMVINYSLLLVVWVRFLVKDYLAKKGHNI